MRSPEPRRCAAGQDIGRLRQPCAARLRINADFALLRSCEAEHERKAWLFAGSELAGQRAAIVMSLVQSAKLNGHDPWAYSRTC